MDTAIQLRKERCDLCGGSPACVPSCPQQILAVRGDGVVMTHQDRCPPECTVCIDVCEASAFSLVEEVHQELGVVPQERIDGPALVHHVAYQRDEDETELVIRGRFAALLDRLGIPGGQRSLGDAHAHGWGDLMDHEGVYLQLTWELHTEYYFVRAILTGAATHALEAPMAAIVPDLHDCGIPPLVTCLDVTVVDRPMNPREVCDLIVCRNRFGNRVLGGELAVYTNYEPVGGRERYVVCGTPEAVSDHAVFAVANIGRVENYYHLLMIPRTEVRASIQRVHRMENGLSARTEDFTQDIQGATREQMERWLKELTVELAHVVRLNGRFNHVVSATFPYGERVREGFAAWKAQPVEGFDPLGPLILERVETVVDEYRAFMARLGRMQAEILALTSILRTRVEMKIEAQNTRLLQNLDTRSATQLRLQELAEGLSIIVITYYMTGLAGYLFKGMEKQHLIGDGTSTVLTALFIPFGALTAWYVAHRGVRKIRKKAGNNH
ncbi:MAG: DUF3422 family protein [Nitrospirae bacterium]|nr:DUF3422 family protein [Nitrospirota bacterium]